VTPDDPRHGTYAGYQSHRKDRETPCAPCRAANAAYTRRMRADDGRADRERRASRVRHRALWRLARIHPDEYARLVADEWAAEGAS